MIITDSKHAYSLCYVLTGIDVGGQYIDLNHEVNIFYTDWYEINKAEGRWPALAALEGALSPEVLQKLIRQRLQISAEI